MSHVLQQVGDWGRGKTIISGALPVVVLYRGGGPNIVLFSDGKAAPASCIRCHDTPCMLFTNTETTISTFLEFPADRVLEVCPSGAMSREANSGAPIINLSCCVYCGACVTRCPVGAIRLVPGSGAVIEDAPNIKFVETAANPHAQMMAIRKLFISVSRKGTLLTESDTLIDELSKRLKKQSNLIGERFSNLLARSLLFSVGVRAALRRKGNNNMRMDLILGPPGIDRGVAEVEFGDEAILDAPRDLLDDIAVLVSRYGWDKSQIVPLVIGDTLPNRRSEYWRIIQDVDRILGIRIGTITVFALMLTNWNYRTLKVSPHNEFYIDCETASYRRCILEPLVGRRLHLGPKLRSLIEVSK